MSNKKVVVLAGFFAGALMFPWAPAVAFGKNANERCVNGRHEKWDHNHWRRDGHVCRDFRHENRGHHNRGEIHKDFSAVHSVRRELAQDHKELHGDYQELRKDRAELRRDIHNAASQKEIFQDRREIRGDLKEIAKDRQELKQDQSRLDTGRRDLKQDLHKR